jgi:adenine-specific DNA methylase
MDFCFVWLRLGLQDDFSEFQAATTRSQQELTGNTTLGRGIEQFTAGLSAVFLHYAKALKPGAPFVFTYHHNDSVAYVPLVVAILDAGLDCTATLPAAAEMSASLHITGTKSSVLDSVFVCRAEPQEHSAESIEATLSRDLTYMRAAGLRDAEGDLRCLAAGHIARLAINRLHQSWDVSAPLPERMVRATICLTEFTAQVMVERLIHRLLRERENTAGQAARSTSGR